MRTYRGTMLTFRQFLVLTLLASSLVFSTHSLWAQESPLPEKIQARGFRQLAAVPQAPQLYKFYQPGTEGLMSSDPGYHDITIGVDGTYSAAPGWDYTTGLGTFDVSAIDAVIQ